MTAPRGYRDAVVTMYIDDYSSKSWITAYLPDPIRYWNGWDCPIFPADTFVKEREAWTQLFAEHDDAELTIKWVGDRLSVVPHFEGEEDRDDVEDLAIDGVNYIGCGAYSMVWEEVHP